jgi:RimJ/RimL family protein N-acetyltransferase
MGDVRLRPATRDDVAFIVLQYSPEVSAPWNWFGFRSETEILHQLDDDGFLGADHGKLIVELVGEGEPVPIGNVSWHAVDYGPPPVSRCWNIGITLVPEFRGCGHGTRAQRLLAEHLLATTVAERVEASTDVENAAERRALERAGFSFEGVLRRAQFRDGGWRDLALYSLVRGEGRGTDLPPPVEAAPAGA